jgi:hypothetical protein
MNYVLLQALSHTHVRKCFGIVFKDGSRYFDGDVVLRASGRIAAYTLRPRLEVLKSSTHCFSTGLYNCLLNR